jgi:2-epi-5-epi-valiolone synthase
MMGTPAIVVRRRADGSWFFLDGERLNERLVATGCSVAEFAREVSSGSNAVIIVDASVVAPCRISQWPSIDVVPLRLAALWALPDGCERAILADEGDWQQCHLLAREGAEGTVITVPSAAAAAATVFRADVLCEAGDDAALEWRGQRVDLARGARRSVDRMSPRNAIMHAHGVTSVRFSRTMQYEVVRTDSAVFAPTESALSDMVEGRAVVAVIDEVVDALYGEALREYCSARLDARDLVVVTAREPQKRLETVSHICERAARANLDRRGVIVAVGGGVTQDLAGFAASIYKRGVGFLRVPTTLVGLVDVAMGVKHGVNAFGRKNVLGTFYPAIGSVNDYGFLRTLPAAELSAGMAEVLKMAMVRDDVLLDSVERVGPGLVDDPRRATATEARELFLTAELLMLDELAPNLFETQLARLVDFGHTFSPAFEAAEGFAMRHGEAVAVDMLFSTAIAAELGVCETALVERIAELLAGLRLPKWHPLLADVSAVELAMAHARLHRGGMLHLALPAGAGRALFVQDVPSSCLRAAAARLRAPFGHSSAVA